MSTSDSPAGGFRPEGVRDYENRRYRSWDQRWVDAREKRILKSLLKRSLAGNGATARFDRSPAPRPLAIALDVPCGYGRFASMLAETGSAVVECDLSPAMAQRAMENARAGGLDAAAAARPGRVIGGVIADATRGLPFRDGAFGLVFSMRLFHHLHDPAARRSALAEFARVSSGAVLLSYYRSVALHRLQRRLRRLGKGKRYEVRMLTAEDFRDEADGAGLAVERSRALWPGLHAQTLVLMRRPGR